MFKLIIIYQTFKYFTNPNIFVYFFFRFVWYVVDGITWDTSQGNGIKKFGLEVPKDVKIELYIKFKEIGEKKSFSACPYFIISGIFAYISN